jgi:hypothetical protein
MKRGVTYASNSPANMLLASKVLQSNSNKQTLRKSHLLPKKHGMTNFESLSGFLYGPEHP